MGIDPRAWILDEITNKSIVPPADLPLTGVYFMMFLDPAAKSCPHQKLMY